MAGYVIDASVVIEYLIEGSGTSDVESFFDQIDDADVLIVPEFCLLECTNVIWKLVRFQGMIREEAVSILRLLRAMKLRRAPMKRLLDRVLQIGLDNQLAVYDSAYIALAQHYGYPLVTIDQKQKVAAESEGITVMVFEDI